MSEHQVPGKDHWSLIPDHHYGTPHMLLVQRKLDTQKMNISKINLQKNAPLPQAQTSCQTFGNLDLEK